MAKSQQDTLIKFDSRMVEANIARGVLTKEEYDKYLAQLPDLSAQAASLAVGEDSDDNSNEPH